MFTVAWRGLNRNCVEIAEIAGDAGHGPADQAEHFFDLTGVMDALQIGFSPIGGRPPKLVP